MTARLVATYLHFQPDFCARCRLQGHTEGTCPYGGVEALVVRSMVAKDLWPTLPGVALAFFSLNTAFANPAFVREAQDKSTFMNWHQLQALFVRPHGGRADT